jgi:hypothetical protein
MPLIPLLNATTRDEPSPVLRRPSWRPVLGHLGTVLRFRDGSWLAIRYRDCHAFPTWSLATAHDSSGSWYESSEHFCGAFSTIRHMESIDRALGETPPLLKDPPTDRGEWIRLLAACPDLPTARKHMKRYFHGVQ